MPIAAEIKSKVAGTTSAAKAKLSGEVGIYPRLIAEHAEALSLIEAAEAATDAATRGKLFALVHQHVVTHAEAEEKEFYAVVVRHTATREYAQINADEHRALAAFLATLQHLEPMSTEWEELFGKFKGVLVAHVDREERELFPAAKAFISDEQAKELETRFSDQKAVEVTRLDGNAS